MVAAALEVLGESAEMEAPVVLVLISPMLLLNRSLSARAQLCQEVQAGLVVSREPAGRA